MKDLRTRYEAIEVSLQRLTDFPAEQLENSRTLFETTKPTITPRQFDVWTCACGLPVPDSLASRLRDVACKVAAQLPASVRTYWVAPPNYHWELFVIKRPGEHLSDHALERSGAILKGVLSAESPFSIAYRGFLITSDGTVIARGYGDFDGLRTRLRQSLPFASGQQSHLGHISLGRILDPVGGERFAALTSLVAQSRDEDYGMLPVREVKYVHEHQWYMEDREVVGTFHLRKRRR